MGGVQTGGVAHCAVDIHRSGAATADEVVVVVSHAVLIECRLPGGLDAADEPFFRKHPEDIIDCLARDCAELFSHTISNHIRRAVRLAGNGPNDGEALRSHGESVLFKKIAGFGHWKPKKHEKWITSRNGSNPLNKDRAILDGPCVGRGISARERSRSGGDGYKKKDASWISPRIRNSRLF